MCTSILTISVCVLLTGARDAHLQLHLENSGTEAHYAGRSHVHDGKFHSLSFFYTNFTLLSFLSLSLSLLLVRVSQQPARARGYFGDGIDRARAVEMHESERERERKAPVCIIESMIYTYI